MLEPGRRVELVQDDLAGAFDEGDGYGRGEPDWRRGYWYLCGAFRARLPSARRPNQDFQYICALWQRRPTC